MTWSKVITFSCLILFVVIHDELIKDINGPYSQLVHLQEGEGCHNSEAEKSSNNVNLDNHIARSSTQRYVSISRGSSGRHSQSHSSALSQ